MLRSSSWRMVVAPGGDEWRGDVRHVHRIAELRDVAVVTNPAYSEARAELRHAPEPVPEQEATVPDEPQGGLTIESRSSDSTRNDPTPPGTVEERILDAIRSVPKGESRSLTEAATATPITPPELSTQLWDRLRDAAVVLAERRADHQHERAPDPVAAAGERYLSGAFTTSWTRSPRAIPASTSTRSRRARSRLWCARPPRPSRTQTRTCSRSCSATSRRCSRCGSTASCSSATVRRAFRGCSRRPAWRPSTPAARWSTTTRSSARSACSAARHVPRPYAIAAHPWSATALSRIKAYTAAQSNETLPRPDGVPPMYLTTQVGHDDAEGTASMVVYAPKSIACVRRRDVTFEVDRSQEFSSDAVLIRGKLRATLFLPHLEAVCVISNAPAPDPTAA